MSLKHILFILFVAISIIPVAIIGVISMVVSSRTVMNLEISSRTEDLEYIKNDAYDLIREKQLVGIEFLLDRNVQKMLSATGYTSGIDGRRSVLQLQKLLQNYRYLMGTQSITLYDLSGGSYTNNAALSPSLKTLASSPWFARGLKSGRINIWGDAMVSGGSLVVPYVREIQRFSPPEIIGYLLLNVNETFLASVFEGKSGSADEYFCIVNERGCIISHTDKSLIGGDFFGEYGIAAAAPDTAGIHRFLSYRGLECLANIVSDYRTGWAFVNIVPVRRINQGVRFIRSVTILISLASLAICFLLAILFSRKILSPINALIGIMDKTQAGDLDVSFGRFHKGEVGRLEKSFDMMIRNLKESFQNSLRMEEEKRKAELKMLEFQINPHFLYNTVSTIIWLADNNEKEPVIRIAEALSEMFRISISRGREIIAIEDELKHVKSYLEIQKIRYAGQFTAEYDLKESVAGGQTVKLILQPLVENSIYHGIKSRRDNKGLIRIEGEREGDDVLLKIRDNGEGISGEKLASLNDYLSSPTGSRDFGIGIKNVHERIRLHFGAGYGLSFGKEGDFTVAAIRIPFIQGKA